MYQHILYVLFYFLKSIYTLTLWYNYKVDVEGLLFITTVVQWLKQIGHYLFTYDWISLNYIQTDKHVLKFPKTKTLLSF